MKFTISKSSDDWHDEDYEKEINTLEELEQFQRESKYRLIISFESKTIEIYDGYRE